MVKVISGHHSQVGCQKAGVHIDAPWDDNVPIGIYSLHPTGHDEVLPKLPEWHRKEDLHLHLQHFNDTLVQSDCSVSVDQKMVVQMGPYFRTERLHHHFNY